MRTLSWIASILLLAACDDQPKQPPAPPQSLPQATILDDQLKAIDKAKAVDDQAEERKRKLDEEMKASGG